MRKKFIKSSRPTYKKRIRKGQTGMKFASYNVVETPKVDITDITNPINPFSEYNYNTTYDKPTALVVPTREDSKPDTIEEPDVVANNPTVVSVINKPVASKVTYTPKSYKGLAAFNKAYDEVEASNPEAKKYRQFLTKMAEQESGFDSAIQNRAGAPAYGYFQFMQDDKKYNNIRQYADTDIETFRNNPKLQIEAAIKLAKSFEKGFSKEDLELANKNGYSTWGLLGGAWLAGNGGVRKFLRGQGNPSDRHWSKEGKGTDVATRIKAFNFKEGGIIKYQEPAQPIKYMGGYDKRGNMVLPVTNENGMNNVTLPEVTVTPRNINLAGAVDRGKRKFLKTTGELATPVLAGAGIAGLGYGLATATIPTLISLGTSYVGTKVGESIDDKTDNNTNYKTMGGLIGGAVGGLGANMTPRLIAGDAYTTVGGKFGYYGNPLQRFTGTVGRRLNLNTKARNPELLRKISEPAPINSNGTIQVSNPTPRADFARTNFTTDRPVVSHSEKNNWDHMDLMIFDPKITKGLKPASVEPSDTFYPFANITAKPSQTTLVSGNKSALINAQDKGMSTLSSPKLRQIYKDMQAEYLGNLTRYSRMTPLQRRLAKTGFKDNVSPASKKAYAEEIQKLQSKRGTPTIKDYRKIEEDTGLDAGVVDIKDLNPELVDKIANSKGYFTYPNGEVTSSYHYPQAYSDKAVLNRMPYNKVFYDPASPVEEQWAIKNGFLK